VYLCQFFFILIIRRAIHTGFFGVGKNCTYYFFDPLSLSLSLNRALSFWYMCVIFGFLLMYDRFLSHISIFVCCFYYPLWCCVHFYVDLFGHKSEPSGSVLCLRGVRYISSVVFV
jgi:hypothetical protein